MANLDKPSDDTPIWNLTRDEQRILWITFLGGLGSIVAAALIIALALAVARSLFPLQHPTGGLIIVLLTLLVCGGVELFIAPDMVRRARGYKRLYRVLVYVLIGTLALAITVFLLTLVGVAAGYG